MGRIYISGFDVEKLMNLAKGVEETPITNEILWSKRHKQYLDEAEKIVGMNYYYVSKVIYDIVKIKNNITLGDMITILKIFDFVIVECQ